MRKIEKRQKITTRWAEDNPVHLESLVLSCKNERQNQLDAIRVACNEYLFMQYLKKKYASKSTSICFSNSSYTLYYVPIFLSGYLRLMGSIVPY